ncbi:MAG: phosphoglycolate phosphatase [Nevskiaceae bacterium]|jgi:phosphoglycolate phosphatase|nr:phosphoglycolate phosphatase [Nevskiaceae bacterium]
MPHRAAAVLFDLDGTLLDTAPDMVAALNQVRVEQGLPALDSQLARAQVSNGSTGLMTLAFPELSGEPFEQLREHFLSLYSQRIAEQTALFPGFERVLAKFKAWNMPWGIVTNKPAFLTNPLLAALNLDREAACIVSGDTLPQRKPYPEPLLHAAERLRMAPEYCVYVGDAQRDVQAAHAAGMPALVALYGYIGPQDDPRSWQPDAFIEHPYDLIYWLEQS